MSYAAEPPSGDDPLDALIVRLAAAYEDPALLKFHLDDVGSAATYLLGDGAANVTGTTLYVDSGYHSMGM